MFQQICEMALTANYRPNSCRQWDISDLQSPSWFFVCKVLIVDRVKILNCNYRFYINYISQIMSPMSMLALCY